MIAVELSSVSASCAWLSSSASAARAALGDLRLQPPVGGCEIGGARGDALLEPGVQAPHRPLGALALVQPAPVREAVAMQLARGEQRQQEGHHDRRARIGRHDVEVAVFYQHRRAEQRRADQHRQPLRARPHGMTVAVVNAAPTNNTAVVTYSCVGLTMPASAVSRYAELTMPSASGHA